MAQSLTLQTHHQGAQTLITVSHTAAVKNRLQLAVRMGKAKGGNALKNILREKYA